MLRRYELEEQEVSRIVEEILAAGMVPLATPFSPEDVEVVASLRFSGDQDRFAGYRELAPVAACREDRAPAAGLNRRGQP